MIDDGITLPSPGFVLDDPPRLFCGRCGGTSFHPMDAARYYCPACGDLNAVRMLELRSLDLEFPPFHRATPRLRLAVGLPPWTTVPEVGFWRRLACFAGWHDLADRCAWMELAPAGVAFWERRGTFLGMVRRDPRLVSAEIFQDSQGRTWDDAGATPIEDLQAVASALAELPPPRPALVRIRWRECVACGEIPPRMDRR